MPQFRPVLYLKASCPFCLKVAAFASDAGLFDQLEIRQFWPDDDNETTIRAELASQLETVTFPALQFSPGDYMIESDAIIDWMARESGRDPAAMAFYQYAVSGPMRRMREQFRELKRLNEELQAGRKDQDPG